ncbi:MULTISPECIES: tetratricopeptide repeat protein [Aequorivita]|uniref:Tetratricopeptide repeat protein n=1 Tax=Aequorivita iocasae TaxID=2803865 RepID=A0ABX7DV39_9FLAO|nr:MULTISPECIES: tetratricopeptide repeat protein [Aequorivita]QQX77417.1 tetratricopeptide repeat protein [Aequorivita iocasae]UCA56907.1 tetratricopeptide repeat protein [Aequorivita sp. F7]
MPKNKLIFSVILMLFLALHVKAQVPKEACDSLIAKGVRLMLDGEHAQSLELLVKAEAMAQENNWHKQHFLAVNNIGANYYSMLDLGEALDNYLEAYTIAIKELDDKYEMIVLNNIAILYLKEDKIDQAQEYFTKAFTIASENTDSTKIAFYAVNLGLVANKKEELKKAENYFAQAIPLLKERPDIIHKAYLGKAENLMLKKQYTPAKEILQPLSLLEDKSQHETKIYALQLLSQIAREQNDIAQALDYANAILKNSDDVEDRLEAFQHLAKIYSQAEQYQEALAAKDSVLNTTQALNAIKNGRLFETNRVKFEIQEYRNQLQENEEKLEAERTMFNIILAAAIIIILLIAWALRNSYIRGKQRKVIHARSQELMALALEKEKSDKLLLEKKLKEEEARALLEEERLKNEIEARNRKLSAKALHLLERNELLTSLVFELEDSQGMQQQSKLNAYIRKLKGLIQSDNEWEQFIKHFEEVNQGFLSAVKEKHPELNANDLRFISYVYMNLTTKEIANILNITDAAARKRKERISRKMDLEDSSLLFGYLSHIQIEVSHF